MLYPRRQEPEKTSARFSPKQVTLLIFRSILSIFSILFCVAVVSTAVSYFSLRVGKFRSAATAARVAHVPTTFFSALTFHTFPDLEMWHTGLELIQDLPYNLDTLQAFTSQSLIPTSQHPVTNADIAERLRIVATQTKKLITLSEHSLFIQHLAPSPTQFSPVIDDLNVLAQTLLRGPHRYLILLQNSDELRATGGFMGSYAILELDEGKIQTLDIQDIYEPDGQFTGFIDPPPGVEEYLSSGHGWRLPDSNWYPDFPTAAKDIERFFVLGKQKEVDGVIAVNLHVIEELLRITGDITLPDQHVTVTPENLAQVARADRAAFFPGSKQKATFLASLFTQVKIRLAELTPEQYLQLVNMMIAQAHQKNLQLYSAEPQIEALFEKYSIDGGMKAHEHSLFVVESNVGINKTNREIHREVQLTISEHSSTLQLSFKNNNQPLPAPTAQEKHKGYVNYQRVYLPAESIVQKITVGNQPLDKWDESIFVSSKNERFKEIGFLVVVPEQTEQHIRLEFLHPPITQAFSLLIQKQSGLPTTPYTVQFRNELKNFLLESDTVLQFTP